MRLATRCPTMGEKYAVEIAPRQRTGTTSEMPRRATVVAATASGSSHPTAARSCPRPSRNGTLVKALARAWRWQRQRDEEAYTSVSDTAEAEGISKSYRSRILRLALLAPDIIGMILEGRSEQAVMLEQLERPLPASWKDQRDAIGQTRQSSPGCMAGSSPQTGG